ncbi:hypothetical protein AWA1501_16570 [Lactiplantibacillus pentosus]|nr:hypothetical protein AWA1501_16570 [Lactiplantibacillus pentosus]
MMNIQNLVKQLNSLTRALGTLQVVAVQKDPNVLLKEVNRAKHLISQQLAFFVSDPAAEKDKREDSDSQLGALLIEFIKELRKTQQLYDQMIDDKKYDAEKEQFLVFQHQIKHLFWHFQGYLNYASDIDQSGEQLFVP